MNKTILPKGTKLWIQEGPGVLHYFWCCGRATVIVANKQLDYGIQMNLTIWKDGMWLYSADESDMFRVAKEVVKRQTKDPDYTKKLMKNWNERVNKMFEFCSGITKESLRQMNKSELKKAYSKFTDLYLEEYAIPINTDYTGHYCENTLPKVLEKYKLGDKFNSYMSILSQPTKPSFIEEESFELNKITQDYMEGKDVSKALEKHSQKWYWIRNNYAGSKVLGPDHFMKRVKEHAKNPKYVKEKIAEYDEKYVKKIEEKEKLITELELDDETKLLIKIAEEHTHWQDLRKKANLIADHYITLFLSEISNKMDIVVNNLLWTTPYEAINLLDGDELDWEVIKQRSEVLGVITTPKSSTVYNLEDSKKLYEEVQSHITINGTNNLYGITANTGKVVGRVKVISTPDEFHKMEKGDILVTSMTRPEFMPILKHAAAIVTNEGGITCHAAIVSRELNIPCILATKIATKVLKDGMLIEVNANHAEITIIKDE